MNVVSVSKNSFFKSKSKWLASREIKGVCKQSRMRDAFYVYNVGLGVFCRGRTRVWKQNI